MESPSFPTNMTGSRVKEATAMVRGCNICRRGKKGVCSRYRDRDRFLDGITSYKRTHIPLREGIYFSPSPVAAEVADEI